MRVRIQTRVVVVLVLVALTLPAPIVKADELESPRTVDLTFLVDIVVETIEAVWIAISPVSEVAADTPAEFGGQIEPVGNESAEPVHGLPEFGGGAEPVGREQPGADEPIAEFGGGIEPVG